MIFVKAGWVRLVYEDQGEPFVMVAGDCVLQPPRDPPPCARVVAGARGDRDRLPGAARDDRRLVARRCRTGAATRHASGRASGSSAMSPPRRRTTRGGSPAGSTATPGIGDATAGLAGVRVARVTTGSGRRGRARHRVRDAGRAARRGDVRDRRTARARRLRESSSVAIPGGVAYRLVDATPDCELLDVTLPATSDNAAGDGSRRAGTPPPSPTSRRRRAAIGSAQRRTGAFQNSPSPGRSAVHGPTYRYGSPLNESPGEPPRLTRTSGLAATSMATSKCSGHSRARIAPTRRGTVATTRSRAAATMRNHSATACAPAASSSSAASGSPMSGVSRPTSSAAARSTPATSASSRSDVPWMACARWRAHPARRPRRSMCRAPHAHAGNRRRTPASRTLRVSHAARSAPSPAAVRGPRRALLPGATCAGPATDRSCPTSCPSDAVRPGTTPLDA